MIAITCLQKGDFCSNTYVVENEKGSIIIDAGVPVENILHTTKKPIVAILITHAHFDHIWYLKEYDQAFHCPIYMSYVAYEKMSDPEKNLSRQFCEKDFAWNIPKDHVQYVENQTFELLQESIECMMVPGHSDCSICYFIDGVCFCGDLLFENGIGRTDFADGNIVKLYRSMKKVLEKPVKQFYPGHGPSFTKLAFKTMVSKRR